MKPYLLPLLFAMGFITAASGQETTADSSHIMLAETAVIHSAILHEDRKIYIYTPWLNQVMPTPPSACPVMYMLDAEYQLVMTAGLVDYLSKAQLLMPNMIVVGIDNNHYDRERDLTPTHSDKADPVSKPDTSAAAFTKTSGGGEKFLQFIRDEVMPYVEQHYKTQPFKIFSGHSLGGLLAVHCLLYHPEMFNAYFAISPSLWWDDEYLIKHAATQLKPGSLKNKFLFISISGEGGQFYQDLQTFHGLLQQHPSTGLTMQYHHYADESHGSGPAKAGYDALKFLYQGWAEPWTDSTASQTKLFYQHLSAKYQYSIQPPEDMLVNKGYYLLDNLKKIDDAISIFQLAAEYYPTSSNVFDSLGDAFAKKGDKAAAIQSYKKAILLNPANKDSPPKLKALEN